VSSTMRPRSVALATPLRCSHVARIMLTTHPTVTRCDGKSCEDCCFVVILLPCCDENFSCCQGEGGKFFARLW
jgi:hypothetical protein